MWSGFLNSGFRGTYWVTELTYENIFILPGWSKSLFLHDLCWYRLSLTSVLALVNSLYRPWLLCSCNYFQHRVAVLGREYIMWHLHYNIDYKIVNWRKSLNSIPQLSVFWLRHKSSDSNFFFLASTLQRSVWYFAWKWFSHRSFVVGRFFILGWYLF